MIYTKPDYYNKFTCIADKCPDTCCAGWQIVIDEESLERYQGEESEYRKILKKSIDWREGVFKQKEQKRCAFLNEDNLCDMCLNLGEDSLCDTCARYPRHIEEYENIREYSLSVSCPEVARILLNNEEIVKFSSIEEEGDEEFEDYDPFLFFVLEDGREIIFKILQNRNLDITLRAAMVWLLSDEMQECIDEGMLFNCGEIYRKYGEIEIQERVDRQRKQWQNNSEEVQQFNHQLFQKLYQLEQLSQDWDDVLRETESILYENGADNYHRLQQAFAKWLTEYMPNWIIMAEQLQVYFIYTYFCGAVYDGFVSSKARMSLASVHFIYELLMARWKKQAGRLDMDDIIWTVYRYSRELEHSDVNLELMEELMEEI